MIAAGLCLMGGCFAQDEASQTVETYWPSHAVRVSDSEYILKDYAQDLTLPLMEEGDSFGGRLENVGFVRAADKTNILCWGRWEWTSTDALYLGTLNTSSPLVYRVARPVPGEPEAVYDYALQSKEVPIGWMQVSGGFSSLFLSSLDESAEISLPTEFERQGYQWNIRIKALNHTCDVVSYWWSSPVRNQYFMVQPMCAVHGLEAFFTHGFDILTEI